MKATLERIVLLAIGFIKHQMTKRHISHLLREKKPLLIEVGAGKKKGENGWITIDTRENCDICWDLRKGIPFPDESISKLYSSHFFEHLSFREGQEFLNECLRVLLPGGISRSAYQMPEYI